MSLMSSFNISTNALDTHAARVQVAAQNIANINTPYYQRKIAVIGESKRNTFQSVLSQLNGVGQTSYVESGLAYQPNGVLFEGVVKDPTPGKKVYDPGHPDADKDGFITLSTTNILGDMTDAMVSSRTYEANLAVVGIVKAMTNRAVEIGRQ